jgi:hypothetical protein
LAGLTLGMMPDDRRDPASAPGKLHAILAPGWRDQSIMRQSGLLPRRHRLPIIRSTRRFSTQQANLQAVPRMQGKAPCLVTVRPRSCGPPFPFA